MIYPLLLYISRTCLLLILHYFVKIAKMPSTIPNENELETIMVSSIPEINYISKELDVTDENFVCKAAQDSMTM